MFTSKNLEVTKNLEQLFKDIQIICLVKYSDIIVIRKDDVNNNCLHLLSVYYCQLLS